MLPGQREAKALYSSQNRRNGLLYYHIAEKFTQQGISTISQSTETTAATSAGGAVIWHIILSVKA